MVRGVLLVVGLLGVMTATTRTQAQGASADAQPICCVADQWSVRQVHTYVNSLVTGYQVGEVVSEMAYDAVNQREVYDTLRSDNFGPVRQLVYYLFYQDNMMYVYNKKTRTCVWQTLNKPFPVRCVPASAQILDPKLTYGVGEENVTAFRAAFSSPRRDGSALHSTITITDDCIPLVEKFTHFVHGGIETETVEFTDMKVGSVPDTLFDLPASCAVAIYGSPRHYPSLSFDF
ncbi:uncharacterized protein LOC143286603 [Babylonia areolata]|uniref:uncharacterized protein LOC143286603 n=1 Tax=Babylonia areolata TaxID=304850 RepID=UPI003FD32684